MDNIMSSYYKCDEILREYGEEKIAERWDVLYKELNAFLEYNELSSVASVNKLLLGYAIVDYFQDIERIKEFHKIKKANSQKVIAYTAYWLLKRKPIQLNNPQPENQQSNITELNTLNERFVLQYISNYLSERKQKEHVLLRDNKGLKNFSKMMLYYLEYRLRDAQSLEMIITSFLAGQIYERTEKDISSELHPYDHN